MKLPRPTWSCVTYQPCSQGESGEWSAPVTTDDGNQLSTRQRDSQQLTTHSGRHTALRPRRYQPRSMTLTPGTVHWLRVLDPTHACPSRAAGGRGAGRERRCRVGRNAVGWPSRGCCTSARNGSWLTNSSGAPASPCTSSRITFSVMSPKCAGLDLRARGSPLR